MAAGGEVSGRKQVNLTCSTCSYNGEIRTATKLCVQCKTAFCGECLKKHNGLYKKHDIQDVLSHDVQAGLALPTEVCQKHSKVVDQFCQHHDKIGCSICMTLEHRACDRVVYILNTPNELLHQSDIKELNSQLATTIKKLESIKLKQTYTPIDLEEGRKFCLEEIDVHHVQLQALLNNLVKTSKDQVDHRYKTMKANLQRHQENVETCLADLKAAQDRLNNCNDNAAQQFVELKKCQGTLKSTEQITTDANENARLKGVDVTIDAQLKTFLTDLKTLVAWVDPLSVKNKHDVDVSVTEDEKKCSIHGSCFLSDGSLLLADRDNKRLKRLDYKSLSITDQCLMKGRPTYVCCINYKEAVVAQDTCLVFVSFHPTLAVTQTLKMNHRCWSVAYSDNELFVTDREESMYVYSMSGDLLRTVTTNDFGQNIFSRSNHVAVSEDGEKVYIADEDNGMVTVDRQGRILATLTHSGVSGTWGVCPDGSGGLFLCGRSSHNVVHIGRRGTVLSEIASESDGLYGPLSLSYNIISRRMYVSQLEDKHLVVVDLE